MKTKFCICIALCKFDLTCASDATLKSLMYYAYNL